MWCNIFTKGLVCSNGGSWQFFIKKLAKKMLQMGIYSTLHRLIIKYQNFGKTLQFFWIFLLSDIMSPCFSTTPKTWYFNEISSKFMEIFIYDHTLIGSSSNFKCLDQALKSYTNNNQEVLCSLCISKTWKHIILHFLITLGLFNMQDTWIAS